MNANNKINSHKQYNVKCTIFTLIIKIWGVRINLGPVTGLRFFAWNAKNIFPTIFLIV